MDFRKPVQRDSVVIVRTPTRGFPPNDEVENIFILRVRYTVVNGAR